MTVFDTDIVTDIIQNRASVVARATATPRSEQAIAVVTAEEMLRGRLNFIRQVEAGKIRAPLEEAYSRLEQTLEQIHSLQLLPFDASAAALCKTWRAMKIRIGTQDLRIAAICLAHGAKLVTRNARDYTQVPGLNLEIWN